MDEHTARDKPSCSELRDRLRYENFSHALLKNRRRSLI